MKALFLIAIILTSGCLGFGGGSSSEPILGEPGLRIASFGPDIDQVEEGERFSLILEVENNGGAQATNIYALLHGISFSSDTGSFSVDEELKFLGSIDGPDEGRSISGGEEVVEWDVTAPENPGTLDIKYEPRVRVMYGYVSSASTTIVALSDDEFTRLRREGESVPSQKRTLVSKGPLTISVSPRQDPVVIEEGDNDIDLIIELNKIGAGTIFSPESESHTETGEVMSEDLHLVNIRVSAPGIDEDSSCAALVTDSNDDGTDERLIGGTTRRINCELLIDPFVGVKEIPIKVDVSYNYLLDRSTSVTVLGQ